MPITPALSEPAANSPVTGAGHAHLLYLSSAMLAVHLGTNALGGYGFIRDELYYLACSDHLAWGYVDHPPLSIALLSLGRLLFGDSLGAVRVLPAISGALVVLLTCLLTGALGGGRSAQVLAALCVMAAPLALGMNAVFSMNSFDVLFWTAAFCLVVRLMTRDDRRDWVLLGLTLGVGLLNKISVLWLGAGLATGLLLTRHRRRLLTPGPWLAAVIALLVFSPHIRWQMNNAYPTLEFIRNAGFGKYAALSPLELFVEQSLLMNPVCLPIWIAGVAYFLGARRVSSFRILPIVYLTVFAILAINGNSKASYLVPLVPLLFSMGGVAIDAMLTRWRGVRAAAMAVVVASGIALAPLVLPVLPVRTYIAYADALGVAPFTSESHELGPLPQHFADMFGWPEMVATIARAYDTLRPEERARCAILLGNYGEAGAVDFIGGLTACRAPSAATTITGYGAREARRARSSSFLAARSGPCWRSTSTSRKRDSCSTPMPCRTRATSRSGSAETGDGRSRTTGRSSRCSTDLRAVPSGGPHLIPTGRNVHHRHAMVDGRVAFTRAAG